MIMRLILIFLTLSLSFNTVVAETKREYSSISLPMRYVSSVPGDELIEKLKASRELSTLAPKLYGSPIFFRSTIENFNTAGGGASTAFSAMLAGGTLGLLPIVTNKDFILRFEILVNGEVIFDKSYLKNMTDAQNMFANNHGELDPEIEEWVLEKAGEVVELITSDEKVTELKKEYWYYFEDLHKAKEEKQKNKE
jgi:hypothetical protein